MENVWGIGGMGGEVWGREGEGRGREGGGREGEGRGREGDRLTTGCIQQ